MKVGILTMHRVQNYGSVLQALALQHTLKNMGIDVEIIDYVYPQTRHIEHIDTSCKSVSSRLNQIFNYKLILFRLLSLFNCTRTSKRTKAFSKFMNEYFSLSPTKDICYGELSSISANFDVFVVGSDQVWSSKYVGEDYSYLLDFVIGKRKISYSSSFGSSVLDDKYRDVYRRYLCEFDYLSVRENSGIDILKDLGIHSAQVVLDPTLLLDRDQWYQYAGDVKDIKRGGYILCYILEYSFNPYPFIDYVIKHVYDQLELKLVFLSGFKDCYKLYNVSDCYTSGPESFIDLFLNASFVITNSFHGTAFALNFNIPFYSIIKSDINTDDRQVCLLKELGAVDRMIKLNQTWFPEISMNFNEINKRLNKSRNASLSYLNQSLK